MTVNGGVEGIFSSIMGIVDEGDEVIIFDPAYDCYRAQIQMAGGIVNSIPLKPKQFVNWFSILEHQRVNQREMQTWIFFGDERLMVFWSWWVQKFINLKNKDDYLEFTS